MARVRLSPTLIAVTIAGEFVALLVNSAITFLKGQTDGVGRWLVGPAGAVALAFVTLATQHWAPDQSGAPAYVPATGPSYPTGQRRRGTPAIVAILAVVLIFGAGGVAVSAGVRYAVGWVTGKEDGPDLLIAPVTHSGHGLTVTVLHVRRTTHFMRVELTVKNTGSTTKSLPISGYTELVSADGTGLSGDEFRSQWQDSIPPEVLERGTITFGGHLPSTTRGAFLSFTTVFGEGGGGSLTVRELKLRAPP